LEISLGTQNPNCLDKYGVDHYSKTDQFKVDYVKTCLDKYGVDHYFKTDQYKTFCLDKYGVDHPMKNTDIFSKAMSSSFRRKPFTYPSGRVDYVLGYEPIVLKELLEDYHEDDIITDICSIPTFEYKRVSSESRPLKDKEFVMSMYYPDILLPDKIIKVKSEYLYNRDKRNIYHKMRAVVKAGYIGKLWVYTSKKEFAFKKTFTMVDGKIQVEKWVNEEDEEE
jgi:hypothetical protein